MKFLIYAFLNLALAMGFKHHNPTPEDVVEGRARCETLLRDAHIAAAVERAHELLVLDFEKGVLEDPSTVVRSVEVSMADARLVEMLSTELEEPLDVAARNYSNAAMMLANAYGTPGHLSERVRMHTAFSQLLNSGVVPKGKEAEIEARIRALIGFPKPPILPK